MLSRRISVLVAICISVAEIVLPGPASAFSLFGYHLWGKEEVDPRTQIADPLPYTITINTEDFDSQEIVENASSLWAERDAPAAGKAGLIATGRGDYRRILAAFYKIGHYAPSISIQLDGQELADMSLANDIPPDVFVEIIVDAGPAFVFGQTEITNTPVFKLDVDEGVIRTPNSVGFRRGAPALTDAIEAASNLVLTEWQRQGHAKAREADLLILANHNTNTLDVKIDIEPGPVATYGPIDVQGEKRMNPDFIAYMSNLDKGHIYDPNEVEEAKRRLAKLGVFRSVRFEEGETLLPGNRLPYTIYVEERKRRAIGFGGTYSTLDGLGLSAYWMHRNLFGRAERLRFDAEIDGLLKSSDWDEYDYNFGVTFTRPGVLNPDTDFISSLVARQLDLENYRERSLTARAGFSHTLTERFNAELFLEASVARYKDDYGSRDFRTFGLSGHVKYDQRDDPLDATRGYYLSARLFPFYEAEYGNAAAKATIEGRIFKGFGEENRYVLGARAKLGTFFGAPIDEAPPNTLFFAGGGGSVRGYSYRSIGVDQMIDGRDATAGGRSLFELSLEARARIRKNIGIVAFVDAGQVNEDVNFTDTGSVFVGAGLGLRYYTNFGPLRVDVALPLNKRDSDDDFGLYIGIGQSF